MTAWVQKFGDGFAVMTGRPAQAELRGLRSKKEAHRVAHDLNRFGRFKGAVTFRTGRRLMVELPAGLEQRVVADGNGTVSDL